MGEAAINQSGSLDIGCGNSILASGGEREDEHPLYVVDRGHEVPCAPDIADLAEHEPAEPQCGFEESEDRIGVCLRKA